MPAEPGPTSRASLEDVVVRAIADGVARLRRNDAIVRAGDGDTAEAVHQMRVATRRLRSDLRTFVKALDPAWATGLRSELSRLATLLGVARDADVLSQRLVDHARGLAPERAAGAAEVIAAISDQQAQARAALLQALGDSRHRALLERLAAAAQAPALRPSRSARPAVRALPPVVRRAWRELERRVRTLADTPSDEELHGVRIAAKRCRYAAEACAPWLGKPTARLARAAKGLQEVLGELNDAVVAERWLRDWAGRSSSGAGVAAAQELAQLERVAARRARARWPKAFKRAAAQAPTRD